MNRITMLNGQVISTKTGQMAATNFTYDSRGRAVQILQGTRTTNLTYDSSGNIASIRNPLNQTTAYRYDGAGRLISQTNADGKSIGYSYDSAGNLTSVTPPGRTAHQFSNNLFDLLSGYLPPSISGKSTGATYYSYDLDKKLTLVTMPDGSKLNYNYDTGNKLTSVVGSVSRNAYTYTPDLTQVASIQTQDGLRTEFNFIGNLKTAETTSGDGINSSLNLNYTNDMKLSSIGLNSDNGLGENISFNYDHDSRPNQIGALSLTRDAQSGLLRFTQLSAVKQSLNYNAYGEIVSDSYQAGNKNLFSAQITRNALGQITDKTETINGRVSVKYQYAYDNRARLIGIRVDGIPTYNYSYDANGNRVHTEIFGFLPVAASYDEQDRLTKYGDESFSYDALGERTKKSTPAPRGKTLDTLYAYDSFGNLKSVTLPDGRKIDYLIDGLGRRIGKKVNGKLVQTFIYQSQYQVAAETDGQDNIVKRFVYGTKANIPDYMMTASGTFRIISDQVGTPRVIANAQTGQVVADNIYTAFGEPVIRTKPSLLPFGFAGGIFDHDTGLVHFGAREYDPETGRWLSKDPLRFGGGDSNLYGYTFGDPVNYIDANGKCPLCVAVGVGAVVGAGSSLLGSYLAGTLTPDNAVTTAGIGAVAGAGAVLTGGTAAIAEAGSLLGLLTADVGSGLAASITATGVDIGLNLLTNGPPTGASMGDLSAGLNCH